MRIAALRITAPILTAATVVALVLPSTPILHRGQDAPAPTIPVSVAAAELTLVCPGALLRIGGSDGTDPDLRERIGQARLSVGSITESDSYLNGEQLNLQANIAEALLEATAVLSNRNLDVEQGSPLLTAAQVQSVEVARMQGLAGSGCVQPTAESWFVAGSTEQGFESVVILMNPSVIASTVTVTAHTATGETRADQIVVPAGETRLFQLDSILNSESEFALQVTASQGKVAAFMQQRVTSGLSALGVDLVTPTAAPSVASVVPGILVRGSNLRAAGETGNWLRVFNPNAEAAELLIEVVGSSTAEFGGVVQATVSANNTVDIPLVGLPDGTYSAFITSSKPVMAGAFSKGAVALEAQDIAWSQAATALGSSFAFAVPSGRVGLQLTNPSAESVTLSISDAVGTTAFVLPPKSTRVYPTASGYLRVDASLTGVIANLVLDSDLGFAVAALGLNSNFGSEILVEVRR